MAKKKMKRRKSTVQRSKPSSERKITASKIYAPSREAQDLNFMVQIHEPRGIRRDILEALREVIIFMQGYETFLKIQREKLETFAKLKEDVKVLNDLIDNRLRKLLPKGKLKGIIKPQRVRLEETEEEEEKPFMPEMRMAPAPKQMPEPEEEEKSSELDDLEDQLADIENRLKNLN